MNMLEMDIHLYISSILIQFIQFQSQLNFIFFFSAISQVKSWMDQLHVKRQVLELTFIRRKTQLEQCLALAILASDLRELEDTVMERRDLLLSTDQLGKQYLQMKIKSSGSDL